MTLPSDGSDDAHRTILHAGPAPAPRPEQRLRDAETSGAQRTPGSVTRSGNDHRVIVASVDAVTPGSVLAGTRYRIIRKLGDGGMGTVYEAEHIDIERRVALKILLPELTRSPQMVEQFRGEARTASKVGSEYIAQVFDFAELPDGSVMFTMELVSGPTLRQELSAGPIASSRAIGLLRQLCKGLDAAHKVGVVHRDIKPDNIVIEQRRGRADAVKILDFGIAAMVGEDRPVAAGTPHYSAPEVVAGVNFDRRADIYGLGCTAYEMLVGRPPFASHGNDVDEVLGSHLAEVAVPPSLARRDQQIAPALDAVIMRCIAKLPSNRFRNMGQLEAALCEAQITAGIQTSWDDLPLPDEVDPVLRERLLRDMPDLHERPSGRRNWIPAVLVVVLAAASVGAYAWYAQRSTIVEPAAKPSAVGQLLADARGAAARSAYVYPTPDGDDNTTAYTKLRELEVLDDPAAAAAAEMLRTELTDTLVRLGDSFWDREGGRTFAVEYYRQALLFDRDHAHARARAELATDALEDLARKAELVTFSEQEIAAAHPLPRTAAGDRGPIGRPLEPTPSTAAPVQPPPALPPEIDPGEPLPPLPTQVGTDERAGADDLSRGAAKLLAAGNRADAEEMFKRALTYDPNNAAALEALGGIALRRGDNDTAFAYAKRLIANAPQRASAHLLAGDAAFALEKFDAARRSWGRALALGSEPAEAKLAKLDAVSPPPPTEPTPKPDADPVPDADPDPQTPDAKTPDEDPPTAGEEATAVSRG